MSGEPGFGVYIHWPFCEVICPYCDFNIHPAKPIDDDAWREALVFEIAHYASETPNRMVSSVYFGGGTPSLMPPNTVAAVLESVSKHWAVTDDIEVTLEANPTSTERRALADFKAAGINRVSVGIQSFNDEALSFLGRTHNASDGRRALEAAVETFERVTFDLIYAIPEQSYVSWERELSDALSYAGGHLSLYQLMIEAGTPFMKSGVETADEDVAADLFEVTQSVLSSAGLPAYEVSNHARPGEQSRHNLTCWRGGDYIGIGPGAHGRINIDETCYATHQVHTPTRWLELTQKDGHGTAKRRPLTAEDRARELVMMGLRLVEGIDKVRFRAISGLDPCSVLDAGNLAYMIDGGLMKEDSRFLRATSAGRQRLNAMIAQLI